MEASVNFFGVLAGSLVLIVIIGAHIAEERLKGFRRFFNLDRMFSGLMSR